MSINVGKRGPATEGEFHPTDSQDESLRNIFQEKKLEHQSDITWHERKLHGGVKDRKETTDYRWVPSRHYFEVFIL